MSLLNIYLSVGAYPGIFWKYFTMGQLYDMIQ